MSLRHNIAHRLHWSKDKLSSIKTDVDPSSIHKVSKVTRSSIFETYSRMTGQTTHQPLWFHCLVWFPLIHLWIRVNRARLHSPLCWPEDLFWPGRTLDPQHLGSGLETRWDDLVHHQRLCWKIPWFLATIHQLCWECVSLWYGFTIMLCLMCIAHCLTVHRSVHTLSICQCLIWSHGEGSGGSNAVRLPAYVYVFNCWKNNKNSWMKKKMSAPMLNPPTASRFYQLTTNQI